MPILAGLQGLLIGLGFDAFVSLQDRETAGD